MYTTSSGPRVRKVTVTEYVYDKDGKILKETCTETEYADPQPYVQPYTYPYTTWTASTGYTGPGSEGDQALK